MHLMHEIRRRAKAAAERGARVDVVLPAVELLVALEGEVEAAVAGFEEEAVRLEVGAFDVGDVGEGDGLLGGGGL